MSECVKYTVRKHGIVALWQGLGATLIRNTPANAMFFPGLSLYTLYRNLHFQRSPDNHYLFSSIFVFAVSELVKMEFSKQTGRPVHELDLKHRLIGGASAGICYWVLTYPLDAIKGSIQGRAYEERVGWMQMTQIMWRNDGWRSFFRGFLPCAARSLVACAAMFTTVDIVREKLKHGLLQEQ